MKPKIALVVALLAALCFPAAVLAADASPQKDAKIASSVVDAKVPTKVLSGNVVVIMKKNPASPVPTTTAEDPGGVIKYIFQAIREGRWAWLVGLLLMLVTWLLNMGLGERIPRNVLPWVSIALGIGSSMLISIASGLHWLDSVGIGVSAGMAGSGGWSALGKYIRKANRAPEPKPAGDGA